MGKLLVEVALRTANLKRCCGGVLVACLLTKSSTSAIRKPRRQPTQLGTKAGCSVGLAATPDCATPNKLDTRHGGMVGGTVAPSKAESDESDGAGCEDIAICGLWRGRNGVAPLREAVG